MVDELKRDVEQLKDFKEFKDYRGRCPNSYLCAGFMIIESPKESGWQIDYYCPDNDKITTFSFADMLRVKEADTAHRKDSNVVELNLENVDVGMQRALDIVSKLRDKNYPDEKTAKIIVILQNIDKREVWNVTYLTSSFKVLNVNVDAQTGDILKEKLDSILNFTA